MLKKLEPTLSIAFYIICLIAFLLWNGLAFSMTKTESICVFNKEVINDKVIVRLSGLSPITTSECKESSRTHKKLIEYG